MAWSTMVLIGQIVLLIKLFSLSLMDFSCALLGTTVSHHSANTHKCGTNFIRYNKPTIFLVVLYMTMY